MNRVPFRKFFRGERVYGGHVHKRWAKSTTVGDLWAGSAGFILSSPRWEGRTMSKLEVSSEILEALQKLSSVLEGEDSLEHTLQTVVDLSVATLPGCDSAGVTLRIAGQDTTAAATDDFTLEIDRIQYETDDGPCLEALERQETISVESLSEETRWPEFRRRASSRDLKSSLSQPLRDDGWIGALNMYSKQERGFDETAVLVSGIFAKQATIALKNAQAYLAARRLADQLNEALRSRDLIGQAKGILMEREGISDEQAFEMLKTASQNSNVKLRDVAQRIIDESAGSSPERRN